MGTVTVLQTLLQAFTAQAVLPSESCTACLHGACPASWHQLKSTLVCLGELGGNAA